MAVTAAASFRAHLHCRLNARTLGAPAGCERPDAFEAVDRDAIGRALKATGGNRMAATRLLQISRASLYERLARWPELEAKET